MLILTKTTVNGNTLQGIPLNNFIGCNSVDDDEETWVAYWDGSEVRKMRVQHSIQDIQIMVAEARHGDKPAF